MNNCHAIGEKMIRQFTVFLSKFNSLQAKYLKLYCMITYLNFESAEI